MKSSVATIWTEIENWLREHAPGRLGELLPGAEDQAIDALEKAFGRSLPDDYRQSLQVHDGSAYLTSYAYLDSGTVEVNIESGKKRKADHREIHDPTSRVINPVWWSTGWLPIAEDSRGNLICLDSDPGPEGVVGQVLIWEMETGPLATPFRSFTEWLEDYLTGLQDGRFFVDEEGFIFEK
jgi:uncharacterized protein